MNNWIKSLFKIPAKKYGTGALDDDRSPGEKEQDYQAEEIASFAPVEWREKRPEEWRKFPIFNQDGSSSCVAQSIAKMLGIENYLEEGLYIQLSARDIYTRRSNKNTGGMWFYEACKIAKDYGATLEALMPSQEQDEATINRSDDRRPSFEVIGKIYRPGNFIALPFDIEKIASIIAQGKPVLLGFRWDYPEWDQAVPQLNPQSARTYHHAVVGVDYTLHGGKKAIVIDDSWGKNRGINGQRVVTEEWFKPENGRLTAAYYFEKLSNLAILNGQIEKPKYKFTRTVKVGSRGSDVAQLQRCLGYLQDAEGYLFPLAQEPTGFYGGITAKAVRRYQAMKGLPATGNVDSQTLQALNQDFS